MAEDIRIKADFPQHFKTRKLIHVAGHEGVFGLISLWCYCRTNKPKGDLSGMSNQDIDIISGFDTKRIKDVYESFTACLHDVGFLDKTDTGYALHDWASHQPFAFYADERSQKAKDSISKRWEKRLGNKQSNTERIRNVKKTYTKCNTPLPYPYPLPSPIPYKDIVSHLNSKLSSFYKSSSKKTQDLITARFNEGFTFENFKAVIDKKVAAWRDDPKMSAFLRPETLFGPKFEGYLNEPDVKAPGNGNGTAESRDAAGRVLKILR